MIGLHRATALLHLLVTVAGLAEVFGPGSVRAASGDLFAADNGSNTIFRFTPDGTESPFASGLNGPFGLAFDSSGNLFEADYNSGMIFKFSPGGIKSTFAFGLSNPVGLAFDSSGNLFVAEANAIPDGRILKFPPSGGSYTVFASGFGRPEFLTFGPPR